MDIQRARPRKEYSSDEAFDGDLGRMREELMAATGYSEQELHEAGAEKVVERLAQLGHAIVDAKAELNAR